MNRDFVYWLSNQRLPMFDIRRLSGPDLWHDGKLWPEGYEFVQRRPYKILRYLCDLNAMTAAVAADFPIMRSPIGELALRHACNDLDVTGNPSAGPMTEELCLIVREGLKNLERYLTPTSGLR